ncbi:MAG: hypothetical protein KAY37_03615 [Phycisphaerae bacterium]|nr:hypothetical protein [Phycisphaerae bacterium]
MKTLRTFWLVCTAMCGTVTLLTSGCGGVVNAEAGQLLRDRLGDTSLRVFPAFVRDADQARYDADAARRIGAFFTDEKLAVVTVAEAEVPITGPWGMDQAKMFRNSVAEFSAYLLQNPLETNYALLSEYMIGGRGIPIGVHVYLLDAEGTCAYAVLLNSHHQAFNDVDPQTVEDCTQMVLNVLREEFTPSNRE